MNATTKWPGAFTHHFPEECSITSADLRALRDARDALANAGQGAHRAGAPIRGCIIARHTQPVMAVQPESALSLAITERWRMICQDVGRFGSEPELTAVNSVRWQRINDTLEEMAVLLVGSLRNDEERSRLDAALQSIWTQLEAQLLQFAELTEQSRLTSGRGTGLTFWERQIAESGRR